MGFILRAKQSYSLPEDSFGFIIPRGHARWGKLRMGMTILIGL